MSSRFLVLAVALGLAVRPAAAQTPPPPDPTAEKQKLQQLLDELIFHTRNISEDSDLETAKLLAVPPPFDGQVDLQYMASSQGACYTCDGTLSEGEHHVASVYCGDEDGGNGVIFAGHKIWDYAWDGKKYSPDRIAFMLAHELGHIRLKHTLQRLALNAKLYKKWLADKGQDLKKKIIKERLPRYGKDKVDDLDPDDKQELALDVISQLQDAFYWDNSKTINAWSREKEDEADQYAQKLLPKLGLDPSQGAQLFLDIGDRDFFASKDKPAPSCGEPPPAAPGSGEMHDPLEVRAWRVFERSYLLKDK
jgi:hypothetical protein